MQLQTILKRPGNGVVYPSLLGNQTIRTSIVIVVFQLVALLLFTDILYSAINIFLLRAYFLELTLPFDLHQAIFWLLFFLHIGKTLTHVSLTLFIVMRWVKRTYRIEEQLLVKQEGMFSVSEKVYDLSNVRSVSIRQSFLGKMFHYGNVTFETSASGGYKDNITVSGIADPQQFAQALEQCF